MHKRKYTENLSDSTQNNIDTNCIDKKNKFNILSKQINDLSIYLDKCKTQQYELEQDRKKLCKIACHSLKRQRESGPYGELYYYCSICELEHDMK